MTEEGSASAIAKKSWLPEQGSWKYHALLVAVAMFVLGPLGGVAAAYMNFSLGFFIGGQVLAGILGSAVTFGYGTEGRHGANYIQTMAASVAGMSGMAVIVQAMRWLNLPEPPAWQLVVYFLAIGCFGVGVGMLYTPVLVDRMRLTYPSGLAVANILRALTDRRLLRRSIGQLGAGAGLGFAGDLATSHLSPFSAIGLAGNVTTVGAGMIVGARITVPAIVVGVIGEMMTPYLVSIGWLEEGEPFRKIFFILALGTILGAAIVDLSVIGWSFARRLRGLPPSAEEEQARARAPRGLSTRAIFLWTVGAGAAVVAVAATVMQLPVFYVALAVLLVFVFVMVNGISLGISDSNPISSATVLTIMLFAAVGSGFVGGDAAEASRTFGGIAFLCATIVLVSCSVGGDMQQDRSTGWRLGTHRGIQFAYQVVGLTMGAVLCVTFAKVFMAAFPVLEVNQLDREAIAALPEALRGEAARWQSAMTYKFVGAVDAILHPQPHVTTALQIGIAIGLVTELLRKLLRAWKAYVRFTQRGKLGFATGFVVDAFILPTPYASSFGGFVDFTTSLWFGLGGIVASYAQTLEKAARSGRAADVGEPEVPEDMSTNSLVGGGIIAGASLAALAYGIYRLLGTVL
ncbi:MAG: OPT/YSL family transporter [Myxococcota bacterium]|nr:OPT/YSL family transporter [Myxococcota bacterium]MDW8362302.1 OPT/YSL family transporter [Myxococcales bacterium]